MLNLENKHQSLNSDLKIGGNINQSEQIIYFFIKESLVLAKLVNN